MYYPENLEGTWVILGSMNMGKDIISNTIQYKTIYSAKFVKSMTIQMRR